MLHAHVRDGLHTLFYFPEGEETNADAARAYYNAHGFSSTLHLVETPDDYFRALRDEGFDPTFVLRHSSTAGTLVYAARRWAGLPVYGMAPGRENRNRPDGLLPWVFAVLAALYGYMVGGGRRDDPVYLPVVQSDKGIVRPREQGPKVNLALAIVNEGVGAAMARSRDRVAERRAELAGRDAVGLSDTPRDVDRGHQWSVQGHGRHVHPEQRQALQGSVGGDGFTTCPHFPEGEETNTAPRTFRRRGRSCALTALFSPGTRHLLFRVQQGRPATLIQWLILLVLLTWLGNVLPLSSALWLTLTPIVRFGVRVTMRRRIVLRAWVRLNVLRFNSTELLSRRERRRPFRLCASSL